MNVPSIPLHVALIPDGNRRWAQQNNVSTFDGHMRGMNSFKDVLYHAVDKDVRYISIWGLSVDNLIKRAPEEVAGLIRIFRGMFENLLKDTDIHRLKVKVRVLGLWRKQFPAEVVSVIESVEKTTQDYDAYNLTIFLAYDGKQEMKSAIEAIIKTQSQEAEITDEIIKQNLFTKDLPPVDLLIRTGGDPHLSAGFMMWDIADSELYFTPKLWPDFSPQEFDKALDFYASRERRLGK